MKLICLSLGICLLIACKNESKPQTLKDKQKEIETGSLDSSNIYKVDEIGWTVRIPAHWEIMTRETLKKNTERGKKAMEKAMDSQIDVSGLVQLLNLKKDQFNSFLSTIEPYPGEDGLSEEEHNQQVYNVIKEAYKMNGIHARYQEDSTIIDGLRFYVFHIRLYAPDKEKIIFRQVLYSRNINGYDFGMTINYNNEKPMEELSEMVYSSHFSKRE